MKKPVVALVILALLLGGWILAHPTEREGAVSGTIESDEVRLASRYGGRVVNLLAAEGDELKPGQVVVELSAPELAARRDQAAALLQEMEHGPRAQNVAAASNEWAALVAEWDLAKIDAKRATDLYDQQTISASDRDAAVQRLAALEKRVEGARQQYDELASGTRPEQIDQVRAQLAEIDADVAELKVAAPCSSSLESLTVKVGDVVAPNAPVATLLISTSRWVRVYIPETWLGHVNTGDAAEVRVDPYPERAFRGVVEQVSRKAEFTPRNVQTVGERVKQVFAVKVRLDDAEGALQPGMAADVTFTGPK